MRDCFLQLFVQILCATDEANGSEAIAETSQAFFGGSHNSGVVGQAQVVISAEVNDLAAADANRRILRRLNLPFALVQAALLQVVELRSQVLPHVAVAHNATRD